MNDQSKRSGGELVVGALTAQGVCRISCVPGESYLPVLDAIRDSSIELDVCRHEAGAGNMAVATGRLTGRAGVAAVTRGPGAMHAAIAVHTAEQDAVPMILLIGQVALRDRERGGFQEMNYHRVFGSVAKWVVSLDVVDRIPETIARAFRIAESGRPGPVVIEMPEDILAELSNAPIVGRREPMKSSPSAADADRIVEALAASKKPLVLVGRAAWTQNTADAALEFAAEYDLPMLAAFRCQDYIDNDSPYYAGHVGLSTDPTLVARLEAADLILAVGGHIGDAETKGYEILAPRADRTVIHVATSESDVDRYLQAQIAVQATPEEFFLTLKGRANQIPERGDWLKGLRAEEVKRSTPPMQDGDVLSAIMADLREELPDDAIVTNGAGNYAIWVHQFVRYRRYGSQVAPASGAMGFGLPAGIAAGLVHPNRQVVIFAGDGCFTMSMTELGVLKHSGVPAVVVIVNNGSYGTIRMHQEQRYPGRISGTEIDNPDFVALGQAFGIKSHRVNSAASFMQAYREATTTGEAAVIEVVVDPNRVTPSLKREPAAQ